MTKRELVEKCLVSGTSNDVDQMLSLLFLLLLLSATKTIKQQLMNTNSNSSDRKQQDKIPGASQLANANSKLVPKSSKVKNNVVVGGGVVAVIVVVAVGVVSVVVAVVGVDDRIRHENYNENPATITNHQTCLICFKVLPHVEVLARHSERL